LSRLRIHCISVSADGFAAGPDQSLEHPMGVGGMALHQWVFPTRTFTRMHGGDGAEGGSTGVDDRFAARGFEGIGAWILGRHMFGPSRGPWPDDGWRGWWGDEPPYHCQVFVLTHHPRPSIEMRGGTTFHFVTEGLPAALERARSAAGGLDVRLGGGAATLRQALAARLVDEMHLAVTPVVLGRGEPLFAGLDLPALGYECTERVLTDAAMHLVMNRRPG
jgi:dihydrofolate reductase